MSHSLESYLITHWARLELAAMSMRDQATSEVVHELRVSYKKVRAVSRVTGVRLALEPIKPLYTACGAVREHEIFEGILSVIDRDTTLGTDPLHRSLQARRRSG